jgi:hypothetical protein
LQGLRVFHQPLRVIASSCEAIQSRKQDWIASRTGTRVRATRWLAMTLRRRRKRPSPWGATAQRIAPPQASPMAQYAELVLPRAFTRDSARRRPTTFPFLHSFELTRHPSVRQNSDTGLIHPLPAPFGDGERIDFLPHPRHGRTGRQRRLRSFPFADEEVLSCAISAMRKPWRTFCAMA